MNPETLKAIKQAILKWEAITAGTEMDLGPANCALCQRFSRYNCRGCPVMLKTGLSFCQKTPYTHWHRAHNHHYAMVVENEEQRKLAKAELDFLKSLI